MSVWPYLLGREYVQSMTIGDLNERVRAREVRDKFARRKEADTRARLDDLEQEIGELALFVRTLYRLALEKNCRWTRKPCPSWHSRTATA